MGAYGPNPISRLAAPNPQMPSAQGYIAINSFVPPYREVPLPGPLIGTAAPRSTWIGCQWAPGQGGDTPGGGGAAMAFGETSPQETGWIVDGYVVPASKVPHQPGWFSWVGSRRSGA